MDDVSKELAAEIARDINISFSKPIEYLEGEVLLTGKIGISLYPEHGGTGMELVNNARSAYNEKQSDKLEFSFYNSEMNENNRIDVEFGADLYNAINNNEFVLYFQPQISVKDREIIGMEALVRWDSKKYGFSYPDFFITRLEANGSIIKLGNWIMSDSMRYLSALDQRGVFFPEVSINVSALQFGDPNLEKKLDNFIKSNKLCANRIKIEITESALIEDPEESRRILLSLKKKGFKISIDDFGTGYGSLLYMKNYPVDEIKIDKIFIQHIEEKKADYAIVKYMIELAHALHMTVVAEGVETESQADLLEDMDCDVLQGFYFSKAISEEEMTKLFIKQPFCRQTK